MSCSDSERHCILLQPSFSVEAYASLLLLRLTARGFRNAGTTVFGGPLLSSAIVPYLVPRLPQFALILGVVTPESTGIAKNDFLRTNFNTFSAASSLGPRLT